MSRVLMTRPNILDKADAWYREAYHQYIKRIVGFEAPTDGTPICTSAIFRAPMVIRRLISTEIEKAPENVLKGSIAVFGMNERSWSSLRAKYSLSFVSFFAAYQSHGTAGGLVSPNCRYDPFLLQQRIHDTADPKALDIDLVAAGVSTLDPSTYYHSGKCFKAFLGLKQKVDEGAAHYRPMMESLQTLFSTWPLEGHDLQRYPAFMKMIRDLP